MSHVHNHTTVIPDPLNRNHNTQWAWLCVDALAHSGLTDVCIAPGSRSTPLTLAFDAHPDIRVHLHLDERSAGFFALGMALTTKRPVALLCTSGTATANFYPAVIEAFQSQIPLLLLTADRPPELRQSGANQTIDQVKLYADQVLWAFDMAVPEEQAAAVVWRQAQTTMARACAIANGLRPGPVHVNFPFRKPLQPNLATAQPLPDRPVIQPAFSTGTLMPGRDHIETLVQLINRHERGIIVCGPSCPTYGFAHWVARFAAASGYPIFADPLSGVRFGPQIGQATVIGGYESWLANGRTPPWPTPEIVIRFGAVPTSKWLNQYLETADIPTRIHVRENGVWADDQHLVTDFWQLNETALCQMTQSLIARQPQIDANSWAGQIAAWESTGWSQIAHLLADEFDIPAVHGLLDQLPDGTHLVMGNSLPIRHLDQFGRPSNKSLHVYGNRGASGIDGVVSTAAGIAAAHPGEPTVLVIGDVSFYHDLNGLLGARQHSNLTIVLLNNNGGGIFRRLPISSFEQSFAPMFITPHDLEFEPAVRMYGLDFISTASLSELWVNLRAQMTGDNAGVVEFRSDGARDEQLRRKLMSDLAATF